jgi:hypothetical protein
MNGRSHQRSVLVPLALLILSLAVYLQTLAPTITWRHDGYDAGDLITAAYTLGIPHPTGYPTYMLLGRIFTLLPVGDVAYRMNLFSAVCSSLTVLLLYMSARLLLPVPRHSSATAACAALLLATSRVFWSQAIVTEVYALNCLFFALTLYLALNLHRYLSQPLLSRSDEVSSYRVAIILAFVYALGLGNHLTIAFSAPLLLVAYGALFRKRLLHASQWAFVMAAFVAGLMVYLYLPLRAGREALPNWGNPRTLSGFLWVVGGGIYRQYTLALPFAYWPSRLVAWMGLLREQYGIAGILLGLLGISNSVKRRSRWAALLLLTFALYSAYAMGYNTTDSYVYLLPVYFLFALWIAHGAQSVGSAIDRSQSSWARPMAAVAGALLLLLPMASLLVKLPQVDLSSDYTAYEFGSQVFAQVPDGAVIVSATDPHTFTLWYFARVVTRRSQVALIDRDLLGYDWYVDGLRRAYPWLKVPNCGHAPLTLARLLQANLPHRPIYFADVDADLMARFPLQEQGILYRLQTISDFSQ